MDLEEFYQPGDEVPKLDQQKRNLVHSAYWHGVALAKVNGLPPLSSEDKLAVVRAVLRGFEENRKYREGARA